MLKGKRRNDSSISHIAFSTEPATQTTNDDALLLKAKQQLQQWLQGERQQFDLPLSLAGTAFQ